MSVVVHRPCSEFRHFAMRTFLEYWLSKCGPDRIPARGDLDPVEMKAFLRYVILYDVERGRHMYRFRYRLVGTHVVDLFGHDLTGEYVDQATSRKGYAWIHKRLLAVVEDRQPRHGVERLALADREFLEFEHLTAPLACHGSDVDMLIGVRCLIEEGAGAP